MSQAPYLVLVSADSARAGQPDAQINEVMPDALYIVSAADGSVRYVNQNGAAMLGMHAEQLQVAGSHLAEQLVHPDDLASLRAYWAAVQALPDGQIAEHEYRIRHHDGSWRWLRSRDKVLNREADGRTREIVGTARDVTERKCAEAALRESEARFRQLAETIDQIFWIIDPRSQRTLYISPGFSRIWGRSADELRDDPQARLAAVHPDDRARVADFMARVIGGEQLAIEYRILRPDGAERWLYDRSYPIAGADGALERVVGIAEDITERRHAEERQRLMTSVSDLLADSIDYDTTLASIANLIIPAFADWCVVDLQADDGSLTAALIAHSDPSKVAWASALREQYPPDPQTPIGAPQVIRTGQPELYPEISDEQLRLAAQGDEHKLQLLLQVGYRSIMVLPLTTRGRTIGALTFVSTSAARRYDQRDLELARDLARRSATALAQAQLYREMSQARREAERAAERTARLLAVTAELAHSLTLEQAAAAVVRQGCAALGASAGLVARLDQRDGSLEILHAEGYPAEVLRPWQRFSLSAAVPLADAIRLREPVLLGSPAIAAARYPALQDMRTSSGSEALAALPLLADGQSIGVFGLSFAEQQLFSADDQALMLALAQQCGQALDRARLYDAERQARAAAEAAVRMRDQFLSIAAHELRNPLAALFGHAQLLERRAGRESGMTERDQRSVLTISEQAARLNRMIDDLLDVSRMGLEQFSIARAPLDLAGLVSVTLEKLRPTLARHVLIARLPDEPLMLQGDLMRLEQMVSNLLSNAVKYSAAGSTVTVELRREQSCALLSVADQGIGIPAAALPHLFQRFYRADNAEKAGASGLGIGLYVVKEVAERHGGSVSVQSEEGHGCVFTVRLPLLDE